MLLGPDGKPVAEPDKPVPGTGIVSITRSFSMKLNLGNYESCDFFASQRAECSPDMADEVSRDLDEFCKDQVLEAIRDFKERRARKEQERARKSAA
jgi:hypothetical protein